MRNGKAWFPESMSLREQGILLAEVRRRDGDACRVCHVIVHDRNRKSDTARNYRILNPGTTLTVDGVVVVCRRHITEGEVQPPSRRPYLKDSTSAQYRAAQAAAAVECEKELAAKRGAQYDRYQDNVTPGNDIRLTVGEAIDNERDGYPTPVGGDPLVTLQEAIDRGAVTITKGLPSAVVWCRSNPGLAKSYSIVNLKGEHPGLWPAPSHEALTDSITALAGVQRRLMIGGVLQCRGDNVDARSAS